MAGGLVALLDDIAALAKLAAASVDDVGMAAGRATAKAAGVVVDDTAVTPRYVEGFTPDRELPVIRRIAMGSIRNKLLFITPAALLLSQFAPWALTPLLMVGGTYLCYEGAEKVWEHFGGHHAQDETPVFLEGDDQEKHMIGGAIRTDFILSSEIMVMRAAILIVVAIAMTVLVYGVVAFIVKMDDIGLHLARSGKGAKASIGRGMVAGMPKVLSALSTIGIVAMLWVGGHIVLQGTDDLGFHTVYGWVHHLEEWAHDLGGAVLGWLANTTASAIFGLLLGAVVIGLLHLVQRVRGKEAAAATH